jgi:hypothetical protein
VTATADGIGAFILARAAEDEVAAQAATPGPWSTDGPHAEPDRVVDAQGIGICWDIASSADADHVARWHPARVLAWVAARRAIVAVHRPVESEYRPADGDERPTIDCAECETGGVSDSHPCMTLRLVAAADRLRPDGGVHPDYSEDWAV